MSDHEELPPYNSNERENRKPVKIPVKAIRKHCLECVDGSSKEVELCTAPKCRLYPYRFGKNPFRSPISEEERERRREMGRRHGFKPADGAEENLTEDDG